MRGRERRKERREKERGESSWRCVDRRRHVLARLGGTGRLAAAPWFQMGHRGEPGRRLGPAMALVLRSAASRYFVVDTAGFATAYAMPPQGDQQQPPSL